MHVTHHCYCYCCCIYHSGWIQVCKDNNVHDRVEDSNDSKVYKHNGDYIEYMLTLSRSHNMFDYCVFLDHFGSALIGVKAWQNNHMQKAISDILTIGDEAFLLTVVDGNYGKWMHDAIHHNASKHGLPLSFPF